MFKQPVPAPDLAKIMSGLDMSRVVAAMARARARGDRYLHWDDVLHRQPPDGLSREEWWAGIKLSRQAQSRQVPLLDRHGRPFWHTLPDEVLQRVHQLDQMTAGHITISETVTNPGARDRYLVSSLIEEAITSSQLEGASTTRKVAREMLRTGRPPRDRSEHMILNNYLAMQRIRELRGDALTPELVLELHRVVTQGTLDDPAAAGRLRRPDDVRVRVWDGSELPVVLHTPPQAVELPERLDRMCTYANGQLDADSFVHPVLRAVTLHFWLAYDHPFEDGNGRTARALFYWSMLQQGYWLAEFLSISSILRRAKAQYDRSFLYTESDDNDLTYFFLHHLRVLERAVEELRAYLQRKQGEVRSAEALLRTGSTLNHRQLALLSRALRDPDVHFTIDSHRRSHGVVYQTARTDLLDLEERGLLLRRRAGRSYVFAPAAQLPERLREAG